MISLILNSPTSTQANRGGTLIVCPLSTLFQWCEEIDRKVKANALDVLVYYGGNRTSEVGKLKAPRFSFLFYLLIFKSCYYNLWSFVFRIH